MGPVGAWHKRPMKRVANVALMRTVLFFSVAALLGGCATPIAVRTCERSADFASSTDKAFSVVAADNQTSASLVSAVQARMIELGYVPASDPAYVVEVGAAARPQTLGAYVPQADQPPLWLESPRAAQQGAAGDLRKVTIRIIETKTGRLVYKGYAAKAMSPARFDKRRGAMIRALLPADPRTMGADAASGGGAGPANHCG